MRWRKCPLAMFPAIGPGASSVFLRGTRARKRGLASPSRMVR
jgi:hypothetical protein